MGKFIHHEPISSGMFNENASCTAPTMVAWDDQLMCSTEVLELLLERMAADYQALNPRMRKPYLVKDLVT